jgi:uncharacterized protein YgiM (DUF1202 family)
MSKHNYSQYSNKKNATPVAPVDEPEVSEVIAEVVTEPAPEVEPVVETVDTVKLPETVTGVVVNCAKLNVRTEPSITADVVGVISAMSEIKIDTNKSVAEWFYVSVDNGKHGYNGYCMKKFVDARL